MQRLQTIARSYGTRIAAFAIAILLFIGLALGGVGWYYSVQIKSAALVVDHNEDILDLVVAAVDRNRVRLQTTLDSEEDGDWQADGVFGLDRGDSYDRVGAVVDISDESVIREYTPLTGGLRIGDKVRLDSYVFAVDPLQAHGIPFQEVTFSSPLGEFGAWSVEGSGDVWAIFVHGKGASRREALRVLPVLVEMGMPALVIDYRNDKGAPPNPDRFYRYGLTEWKELEGAAQYAMREGAEGLILIGYSMGGAIVTSFMYESSLAESVRGLVLDSPMLDFGATVDHGASQRSIPLVGLPLPGILTSVAKRLSSIRYDVDFEGSNYLTRTDQLKVPILLFQGDGDKTVPPSSSDALFEARPDLVRYVTSTGVGHVRSWNAGQTEYQAAVKEFLAEVGR